ncbi:ATP synthase subunit C lysine N-methyltransferase [Planococcus citri]|uniref:ATP synthase subunit C lysine N-methyltransferase n=1 Tax=Planococcus citri TaxID=170843 RepID=UPI0031F9BE5F
MSPATFQPINENTKHSKLAYILLSITGGTAVTISLLAAPFLSPAFRKICLPYVPATSTQMSNVMKALRNRSGKLVDLGSGDGRIVRLATAHGFEAVGVELNIWLILYSRFSSFTNGLSSSAKFYRKNIWSFDLKPYSNVILFGAENMMDVMEKKLATELSNGSVVITCRFPLPNFKAVEIIGEGQDTVWKYVFRTDAQT